MKIRVTAKLFDPKMKTRETIQRVETVSEETFGTFDDIEEHVFRMWSEGNYSCDCNRSMFMYHGQRDYACGNSIVLEELKIEKL